MSGIMKLLKLIVTRFLECLGNFCKQKKKDHKLLFLMFVQFVLLFCYLLLVILKPKIKGTTQQCRLLVKELSIYQDILFNIGISFYLICRCWIRIIIKDYFVLKKEKKIIREITRKTQRTIMKNLIKRDSLRDYQLSLKLISKIPIITIFPCRLILLSTKETKLT